MAIRDTNAKTLLEGGGTFELFHDSASINGYLKQRTKTVELFKALRKADPELAKVCYGVAEPDLAAAGEYKLCRAYIPDPLKRFEQIRKMRAVNLKLAKTNGTADLNEFAETTFLDETRRLIEILAGSND